MISTVDVFRSVGLGIALFGSTNLDDLFVLLAFFSDRRFRWWQVVAGQYLGLGALTAVSVLGAFATVAIPFKFVGLLGLFPFLIGAKELARGLRAWRSGPKNVDATTPATSNTASVALVTIANGGDNVAAYIPTFATRSRAELLLIVVTFVVMATAWCIAAHILVNHRTIGAPIRRYGQVVLPWLLMALGVYVFVVGGAVELVM